jgi:hypothetical protein
LFFSHHRYPLPGNRRRRSGRFCLPPPPQWRFTHVCVPTACPDSVRWCVVPLGRQGEMMGAGKHAAALGERRWGERGEGMGLGWWGERKEQRVQIYSLDDVAIC